MDINTLLYKVKRLPANPQIMLKLMNILQDLETDTPQIVSLIKVDAALTAQVLRLANSAYYGVTEHIYDLESAIGRIGFRETYMLVGAVCSNQYLNMRPNPDYPGSKLLWEHTLLAGLLMEEMSLQLGLESTSTYTIGLLHSIGRIVISQMTDENNSAVFDLIKNQNMTLAEAESKIFGYTNTQVAVALLKSWNFPDEILSPIRNQLDPLKEIDQVTTACLLHTSVVTAQSMFPIPGSLDRRIPSYQAALEKLQLEPSDMDEHYEKIFDRFSYIKETLSSINLNKREELSDRA